jgi:fatty-acyl-CoA synthase
VAQRRHLRLARGVSDRDVYLHTLPMFHCNGWGMPYALTGMGVPQVVLRKVDGAEILRASSEHGVTLLCGAPPWWRWSSTPPQTWDGPVPGARPHPHRGGRRAAAHPHHRAGRDRARLGVHPDLRPHRDLAAAHDEPHRAEWDDLDPAERAQRSAGPARRRSASTCGRRRQGEVLARGNHVLEGYWQSSPRPPPTPSRRLVPHRRRRHIDDEGYLTISDRKKDVIISGGENVSSIEVEDACSPTPRWPRWR